MNEFRATLGEGHTPLVPSTRIGPELGLSGLWFKLETCNPTGSYKDRFVASEMSELLRRGVKACLATSSGNTGSSLASYCARYGIRCAIVVSQQTPSGKLAQMRSHGAELFLVRDFITSPGVTSDVLRCLRQTSEAKNAALVLSAFRYCPRGMRGVQSISAELGQQTGGKIRHVFVPVGGGGLYVATCRGFDDLAGVQPLVHAVQPRGCPTVVDAFEQGTSEIRAVESTTTISGLAVPFDIDAGLALKHLRDNGGEAYGVNDEEVYEAQRWMLTHEGIYCEPAGAAALAGLRRAVAQDRVQRDDTIVCLVTGHGFKDPDSIQRAANRYPGASIEASELEDRLLDLLG